MTFPAACMSPEGAPCARAALTGNCDLNGVTSEMKETLVTVTDVTTDQGREPVELPAADGQLLRELTERARAGG